MRSNGYGLAFGAFAIMFTAATTSVAQAPSEPGQPGPGAEPAAGATLTFGSDGATLSTGGQQRDEAQDESSESKADKKDEKLPWRGTTFTFEQSATTQTVGLGDDYISDNPVYELFFSFRPRYYFYDDGKHSFNVNMRFDLTQELTNSDSTTQQREAVFGNIGLNASYGVKLYKNDAGWSTTLNTGPRITLPADKYAYRSGQRLQLGWSLGGMQALPVAGQNKTWFPTASLNGAVEYRKMFNEATTSVNDDFERQRMDTGLRPLISDQLSPVAKVSDQLTITTGGSLDITSELHLTASYLWILQWTHKFSDATVDIVTGPAPVGSVDDPQTFRVVPWFMASIDYDIIPELGMSLGYYNVTNQIGADGQRRNPLWSPDARVFLDLTANLDEIYKRLAGKSSSEKPDSKPGVSVGSNRAHAGALTW